MSITTHASPSKIKQIATERRYQPEHLLLVVNIDDDVAQAMADYYQSVRGVPDANILQVTVTSKSTFNEADWNNYFAAVCQKLDEIPTIRCICPVGDIPQICYSGWYTALGMDSAVSFAGALMNPFATKDNYQVPDTRVFNQKNLMPIPHLFANESKNIGKLDASLASYRFNVNGKYPLWEALTRYRVGDVVITTVGGEVWYKETCIVAGTSDAVEPTQQGGDFVDGTVTWSSAFENVEWFYSPFFRMPLDHYAQQETVGTDVDGSFKYRLGYAIVFLNVPEVGSLDPDNASRLELFKRVIDDSIFIESLNRKEFVGNAVLQASSSGLDIGGYGYIEADLLGIDGTVYHQDMDEDQSAHPSYDLPVTNNLYSTNTTLTPRINVPFVDTPNVFLHGLGHQAYHGAYNTITKDNIQYARGAITCFDQSFGATPQMEVCTETIYENATLEVARNIAVKDALGVKARLSYGDPNGNNKAAGSITYTGATATAATVTVTADNTIVLKEDGATIATINLTTEPMYDQFVQLNADVSLIADWSGGLADVYAESRVARALKNGAAVSSGVTREPGAKNGTSISSLIQVMYSGGCLADYVKLNMVSAIKNGSGHNYDLSHFYGDPLYTPCAGYFD